LLPRVAAGEEIIISKNGIPVALAVTLQTITAAQTQVKTRHLRRQRQDL
jgi:antitoxin (DNA-binding transcriptional repressor) of toxin-antitoxin stability system